MPAISWSSFILLALLFVPLVYLQRILQREIQSIFLLFTRQSEISMALFSLLFLPGVLLHEISHFLMAKLLEVPTGRFSIIPKKLEGGRIQLGYVETAPTDFVRDALIGMAPLLVGILFIALVGVSRLGMDVLWSSLVQGQLSAIDPALVAMLARPDFWLWFYLVFTVSSTMLPSASDRRAWLPLILVLLFMLALIILVGVGPWLLAKAGPTLKAAVDAVTMVLGVTVLIHLILAPPAFLVRKLISRLTGLQVV